jgi:ATPase family associated with various cellular activities (AAA)
VIRLKPAQANELPGSPPPHLPERHSEVIIAHILRNLQQLPGPIFLGIDGPSGAGKTFGVTETLRRARVGRLTLSGADLESHEAGRPAALLRRAYVKAAAVIATGRPAVVVLDDLDASLGRWDDATTYTVNHQLTITELMHLADSPTRVDGRTVRRVPVILTGNHLARLYSPLRRPGRMQIHPWDLTPGEKVEVIQGVFRGVDADVVLDLIGQFLDQPIAFFADLRRRAKEDGIRQAVRRLDAAHAVRLAVTGQLPAGRPTRIDPAALVRLGRQLLTEQAVHNHLGGEE